MLTHLISEGLDRVTSNSNFSGGAWLDKCLALEVSTAGVTATEEVVETTVAGLMLVKIVAFIAVVVEAVAL